MNREKIYENPDPGVKWALDILSPDPDFEEISIVNHYKFPAIMTGMSI